MRGCSIGFDRSASAPIRALREEERRGEFQPPKDPRPRDQLDRRRRHVAARSAGGSSTPSGSPPGVGGPRLGLRSLSRSGARRRDHQFSDGPFEPKAGPSHSRFRPGHSLPECLRSRPPRLARGNPRTHRLRHPASKHPVDPHSTASNTRPTYSSGLLLSGPTASHRPVLKGLSQLLRFQSGHPPETDPRGAHSRPGPFWSRPGWHRMLDWWE